MKALFTLISAIIMIVVIFLASLNLKTAFDLIVWNANGINSMHYHVSLIQVLSFFFIAGILVGALWAGTFYISLHKKLKEYQRKLEKTSVQSDEDSSKVEVLEAKIQTLEKALESALKNNNNE